MSTQPTFTPQWKEEVNRRLAAHKSRRGQSAAQEEANQQASLGASRAAEAAARVAARYAKAPSYSQMQAEETRVAVRAAEIATKVALEAQAVAETALAEMHAATQDPPSRGPAVVQSIAAPSNSQPVPNTGIEQPHGPRPEPPPVPKQASTPAEPAAHVTSRETNSGVENVPEKKPEGRRIFGIRWDSDLPRRSAERKPEARRPREEFELSTEDWWSPAEVAESLRSNPIEVGEADQAHANLIEFPRELVATRKMRPGATRDEEGQLSIFEVDPASIATEAGTPAAEQGGASIWNRPEWSGIRLDPQPVEVLASAPEMDPAPASLPVASLGTRLMAAVVDCALILACFVMGGFVFAHSIHHPPAGKPAELLGAAGLALVGMAYYAFFFALPASTPGMMYAGIGLCTFSDQSPTRAQLRRRLLAMLLSILPVGLGLVWSLFDDDHLSWHDRYSQTYPRRL
ncbi:MAG TPA: RDD family protein [Terracidiphilus sp.]